MADWEEIKRLAADFQRTQTSDTLQRISERNCIDIVKKLTDLNLIELIYTCDGKEFITPSHLIKEIQDEVLYNGGRMHIHELSTRLNVDYQHVENKARELARDQPDEYDLVLGQILHSSYNNVLSKQISDSMILNGKLSVADFAKSLDLPSEYLLKVVNDHLPHVIRESFTNDQRTYYSSDLINRYRAMITGALTAITHPTSMVPIMKRVDIPEAIFMSLVDGLIKSGRLDASIEDKTYVPAVHAREQNEYIEKFYSSNGYLEYDVLSRLDIKQPKAFLRKKFPDGIPLKNCFVGPILRMQVESLLEDCATSDGWVDLSTMVSASIDPHDMELLVQDILKHKKELNSTCVILNQTCVCSNDFIAKIKCSLENLMHIEQEKEREQAKQRELEKLREMKDKQDEKATQMASTSNDSDVNVVKNDNREEDKHDAPNPNSLAAGEDQHMRSIEAQGDAEPVEKADQATGKDNRKDKKGGKKKQVEQSESEESDDDDGRKKGKNKKGTGGGARGREVRQKAVKKKYIPGMKGKQQNPDDDESTQSKGPRSNKGRAARRAVSPDRPAQVIKTPKDYEGLLRKVDAGGCPEEILESIVSFIWP